MQVELEFLNSIGGKNNFTLLIVHQYIDRARSYTEALSRMDGLTGILPALVIIRALYENCERAIYYIRRAETDSHINRDLIVMHEWIRTSEDITRLDSSKKFDFLTTKSQNHTDFLREKLSPDEYSAFSKHGPHMASLEKIATANGNSFIYNILYRRISKYEHNLDLLVRLDTSENFTQGSSPLDFIHIHLGIQMPLSMLIEWSTKFSKILSKTESVTQEGKKIYDVYASSLVNLSLALNSIKDES